MAGFSSPNLDSVSTQHCCYGRCARGTFGCAGVLTDSARSANPRTAATLRLAANSGCPLWSQS
ncbi:hypothetical protein E1573_05585 [Pseudomonas sp. H9]|nr:hypothetical protein E1573_05585 [Pseudomonas sp. H9]